jgi:heat shock protein HslJ
MSKEMSTHLSITFVFILLLLTNCSTKETVKDVNKRLHDIWALESINGKAFVKDEQTNQHPVIEIYVEEKRVHGNAGCNTINGKIEVDESNITFSEIMTTQMACPGDLEQKFLAALQSINSYKLEKLRLFLYEDEEERLVFRKID